ncbi:MAG: flagellar basal body rod C-terminal domain-containing protein, partial [Acetivibrio sp.]
ADGTRVNTIKLTDFENYDYLKKIGDTSYKLVDGGAIKDAEGGIVQGFTEQSNVNPVNEMVEMISITRAYEANQKVISTVDTMLDKSVNSIGRVG